MEQDKVVVDQIKRNIPRDLFLHLLAIVTLYWSAVTFVTLLYQFINYFFPLPNYYYGATNQFDKFAIASLIIVFPVFILVSWYLNKIYSKDSQVRESKIRKWLIYLTLFVASLVIIGDLVTAILYLLNGDFTIRFMLKVLSILLVAGGIFGYYLDDVRKEIPSRLAKTFAIISGILVLIAVVCAFPIIGSPKTNQQLQSDQRRIEDLQNIQSQVVYYWQKKQVMPTDLSVLSDSISGFVAPLDPQTNASYEYIVGDIKVTNFELCATFNKPSQNTTPKMYYPVPVGEGISQNWEHSAGRVCFERPFDKQIYSPQTNPLNY